MFTNGEKRLSELNERVGQAHDFNGSLAALKAIVKHVAVSLSLSPFLPLPYPFRTACPSVNTLVLEKALARDQFFRFKLYHNNSCSMHKVVEFEGVKVDDVELSVPSSEDIWLCPYFNTESQTLRLRKRDGTDFPNWERSIDKMSRSMHTRALLELAKKEGLISFVPRKLKTRRLRQVDDSD